MTTAVNRSLTDLLQHDGARIGGPMEWKIFLGFWNDVLRLTQRDQAGSLLAAKRDAAETTVAVDRKIRRQAEAENVVRERRERDLKETGQKKQDEEHDERLLTTWQASEECRRAWLEFSRTMDDLQGSVQRAYALALEREQAAAAELGIARQRALVLADGRRVYFTRDGRLLYGEDRREITDGSVIEEARRRLAAKPDPADYETYTAKDDAFAKTSGDAHQLAVTLQRLNDLRDELKPGELTPERLAKVQREAQDIIASLPPDARQEFERVEAARRDVAPLAYRAADPAFNNSPDLTGQFSWAVSPPSAPDPEHSDPPTSGRAPYRAGPQF